MTTTLAQKFAARNAKGVVPAALAAIASVKRNSRRIAALALAVSTPHQALFLFGLGHPHGLLDIIVSVAFALLIPAAVDLGMLTMLTVTQTVGIAVLAKRRAMIVLAVLVTVSAAVNFGAEGPVVIRLMTAFVAVMLAAVEWVSSAIAPDFAALEATETAAQPAPVKRTRAEAARLGWERKRLAEVNALQAQFDAASAPVSGA